VREITRLTVRSVAEQVNVDRETVRKIIVFSNPTGEWMFVCCESSVLSGRGLCDGLITYPEETNRMWFVVVCDPEKS
jgi:hypothetical protein